MGHFLSLLLHFFETTCFVNLLIAFFTHVSERNHEHFIRFQQGNAVLSRHTGSLSYLRQFSPVGILFI